MRDTVIWALTSASPIAQTFTGLCTLTRRMMHAASASVVPLNDLAKPRRAIGSGARRQLWALLVVDVTLPEVRLALSGRRSTRGFNCRHLHSIGTTLTACQGF